MTQNKENDLFAKAASQISDIINLLAQVAEVDRSEAPQEPTSVEIEFEGPCKCECHNGCEKADSKDCLQDNSFNEDWEKIHNLIDHIVDHLLDDKKKIDVSIKASVLSMLVDILHIKWEWEYKVA